jgi:predicted dehydrogenase
VFCPLIVKAREVIAQGAIGRVKSVVGFCGHGGPSVSGWYRKPALSGGGANIDLGPHTLETALYLGGKPPIKRMKSCALTKSEQGHLDVRAEMVLESENGVKFNITSYWLETEDSFCYEVSGEKGKIKAVFEPVPQSLTLSPNGGEPEDIDFPGRFDMSVRAYVASMGYVDQLAHFEKCFRSGKTPSESGVDGRNVLRILMSGYMSAAQERPIELSSDMPADRTPVQAWLGG